MHKHMHIELSKCPAFGRCSKMIGWVNKYFPFALPQNSPFLSHFGLFAFCFCWVLFCVLDPGEASYEIDHPGAFLLLAWQFLTHSFIQLNFRCISWNSPVKHSQDFILKREVRSSQVQTEKQTHPIQCFTLNKHQKLVFRAKYPL